MSNTSTKMKVLVKGTHNCGMDKRIALGSHRPVRIARNPMDPSKLRWDQFYQFKNRFNCNKSKFNAVPALAGLALRL